MRQITRPQRAVLEALAAAPRPMTARQVAKAVWPDDPGWQKRTQGRGASRFTGALGATMPLRAGRVLSNIEDWVGVRRNYGDWHSADTFEITETGREVLGYDRERDS